jgi:hypothetical protein
MNLQPQPQCVDPYGPRELPVLMNNPLFIIDDTLPSHDDTACGHQSPAVASV